MTRKTYGRNKDRWASNYVIIKLKITPARSLEYGNIYELLQLNFIR